MFSLTTLVYTADKNWILLTDLIKMTAPPPLMVWRDHGFRPTRYPYKLSYKKERRQILWLETIYEVNVGLTRHQRVLTRKGLMKTHLLTPEDEIYLCIDMEKRPTRPKNLHMIHTADETIYVKLDRDWTLVTRDIDSRWNAAFNIGIVTADSRGDVWDTKPIMNMVHL